jgi:hypothetical protein
MKRVRQPLTAEEVVVRLTVRHVFSTCFFPAHCARAAHFLVRERLWSNYVFALSKERPFSLPTASRSCLNVW